MGLLPNCSRNLVLFRPFAWPANLAQDLGWREGPILVGHRIGDIGIQVMPPKDPGIRMPHFVGGLLQAQSLSVAV